MKKKVNTILTVIVLAMAILQAPLIYYYTFGLVAFFVVPPYMLIGAILTIVLLTRVYNDKCEEMTKFQTIGSVSALILGIGGMFLEGQIEKLDWKFRKDSRLEIIEKVKEGKLVPNNPYNSAICPLNEWKFPPISNGGNEIAIYYGSNGFITVKFYINRGFLDHYSAFVYTNDTTEIRKLNERTKLYYDKFLLAILRL